MALHWRRAALAALVGCSACGPPVADRGTDRAPRLYVTSGVTDEVLVLDARDGRPIQSLRLDRRPSDIDEPHGIVVDPDQRHFYVTLAHGNPTLWKYELPDNRLVGRVALGTYGAARIGVTPDGRRAFIPDYYRSGQGRESGLAVVELFDLTIVARPTICPAPHDAQVDPDGRRVAVACSLSDEIVLMDASTLQVVHRFYVDSEPGQPGAPRFKPLNLLWSPSGDVLYVGLFAAGELRSFDMDGDVLAAGAVGAGPTQMALTPDGRTLVVANRNDASVSLLELPTLRERIRVRLDRPHPHGVTLDAEGRTAFVTYEGDTSGRGGVAAIELAQGELLWVSEAGVYTLGIAYVAPVSAKR